MELLLDVSSLSDLIHEEEYYAVRLQESLNQLLKYDIKLSVSDKCLDNFCWHHKAIKNNIKEAQQCTEELKDFLSYLNINVIKANEFHSNQGYIVFEPRLKNYFSHLQISYAIRNNYSGILTNNPLDFKNSKLKILSLEAFIQYYNYEMIYDEKYPIIIDFSRGNILNEKFNKDHIIDNFLSKTHDFVTNPEYFLRVTKEINVHDIIKKYNVLSIENGCQSNLKKTVKVNNHLEISTVCWKKNEGTHIHFHDDSVCATFIKCGTLTEETFESSNNLKTSNLQQYNNNSWNLVRLKTKHRLYNKEDECLILVIFKLFISDYPSYNHNQNTHHIR